MSSHRAAALAFFLAAFVTAPAAYATPASPAWGNAAVVERDGFPVFEFRGRPFFLYGAAFFYERLPRERWAASMDALRALGVNTLDLYVPWNWHETADGVFDFDGHTNPRRDFDDVLRLARARDFALVLRPGPVIRNEWRNGGYPAWLLNRPEYGMPAHDLLEGRYPPTATLQNAHSDDAAAEWLRNGTHVRYARRWLQRVLRECAPDADRIVAIALDDDQGAYIDNQTYPAPHLRAYLTWLRGVVHAVTGPRELVFINTYQMKVPASSPVWTMGNWYQSEAYTLGEHDRAQLEFSTALLQTRPHQPLFASEFQAGWLEGPDDARPRPANPDNTSLALGTLFALGVRGIVNFPLQDTSNPSGWEAPFANAFYAWDAALGIDGAASARYAPTAEFGALVRRFGPELAAAEPQDDAAIAYLGGSFPPGAAGDDVFADVAAQTILAQQACRAARLACALVDPAALGSRALRRYPLLVVPRPAAPGAPALLPAVRATLAAYTRAGGRILAGPPSPDAMLGALSDRGLRPVVSGVADARFARLPAGDALGFLTVTNYDDSARTVTGARVYAGGRSQPVPPFSVLPHRAVVVVVPRGATPAGALTSAGLARDPAPGPEASGDWLPLRDDARLPAPPFRAVPPQTAVAYRSDVFGDADTGQPGAVVLDNGIARLVVAPEAGARAFVFEDLASGRNIFSPVGALRDDVAVEAPPSATDRIAKYTHQMPAGTFNRSYATTLLEEGDPHRAAARFVYDAPDVLPAGGRFARRVTLEAGERAFTLDETFEPGGAGAEAAQAQRAVSVSSLTLAGDGSVPGQQLLAPGPSAFETGATRRVERGNAIAFWNPATRLLATVAWRAGDVEDASFVEKRFSVLVRLVLAPARTAHVRFGYAIATLPAEAVAALAAADESAQRAPSP